VLFDLINRGEVSGKLKERRKEASPPPSFFVDI
jgi:hypothetical protein